MFKSKHIKAFYIILCFLCFGFKLFSQHHISKYEIRWAFFHPFAAIKIKCQLPKAMMVYKSVKESKILDTLESGGKLDAFRHSYTMAFLARTIKAKKLRNLGIAHEKGNKLQFYKNEFEHGERPDSLSCEMDLRNNDIGILLGRANKRLADEELKQVLIKEIMNGGAWYLKRNEQNKYVACDGKIVDFKQYTGSWSLPKCLVKTNE